MLQVYRRFNKLSLADALKVIKAYPETIGMFVDALTHRLISRDLHMEKQLNIIPIVENDGIEPREAYACLGSAWQGVVDMTVRLPDLVYRCYHFHDVGILNNDFCIIETMPMLLNQ